MTSRLIDVTPQILNFHRIYGGSDSTKQNYVSSSRCLNYSNGASIQRAEQEIVSDIPRRIEYKDSVGLFGAENHFVKIFLKLENPITGVYITDGYYPARATEEEIVAGDEYTYLDGAQLPGQALVDLDEDLYARDMYDPAQVIGELIPNLNSKYFKVELKNLKTGNKYIDAWLDVRLYNQYYDEHPYDIMYVKQREPFYIGFHARNTKRLPYNVLCVISEESEDTTLPPYGEINQFDNKYLATKR